MPKAMQYAPAPTLISKPAAEKERGRADVVITVKAYYTIQESHANYDKPVVRVPNRSC